MNAVVGGSCGRSQSTTAGGGRPISSALTNAVQNTVQKTVQKMRLNRERCGLGARGSGAASGVGCDSGGASPGASEGAMRGRDMGVKDGHASGAGQPSPPC